MRALESMAKAGHIADLAMDLEKMLRGLAAEAPEIAARTAYTVCRAVREAAGQTGEWVDRVEAAERGVIEAAKEWLASPPGEYSAECDALIEAIETLEATENAQ